MDDKKIQHIIESILFITGQPVEIKIIADAIDKKVGETKKLMDNFVEHYNDSDKALKIIQIRDAYQLTTRPENFEYISKIYEKTEKVKITPSLIETLSIVAYKQPVTKTDIENIRGVKSDHVINKLIEYELIEEQGRLEKIGRPIVFGTTDKFLRHFGFTSINDLPEIKDVKANEKVEKEEEKQVALQS